MKKIKHDSTPTNKKKTLRWSFLLLTLCHYIVGMVAIYYAVQFATSIDSSSQKISGFISILCVAFFAATQPDMKFHRVETGWRFLDKKLN